MGLDIYNTPRIVERITLSIKNDKKLTKKNKSLIFEFQKQCVSDNLTLKRTGKCMESLHKIALSLNKNFDKVNKEDKAILELNGIENDKKEIKESILKPKKCPRCDIINSHDSKFCNKCSGILDVRTAMELQQKTQIEKRKRSKIDRLMEVLMNDDNFSELFERKAQELGLA